MLDKGPPWGGPLSRTVNVTAGEGYRVSVGRRLDGPRRVPVRNCSRGSSSSSLYLGVIDPSIKEDNSPSILGSMTIEEAASPLRRTRPVGTPPLLYGSGVNGKYRFRVRHRHIAEHLAPLIREPGRGRREARPLVAGHRACCRSTPVGDKSALFSRTTPTRTSTTLSGTATATAEREASPTTRRRFAVRSVNGLASRSRSSKR